MFVKGQVVNSVVCTRGWLHRWTEHEHRNFWSTYFPIFNNNVQARWPLHYRDIKDKNRRGDQGLLQHDLNAIWFEGAPHLPKILSWMMGYQIPLVFDAYLNSSSTLATEVLMTMSPFGLQHWIEQSTLYSCRIPGLSDGHLGMLWLRWPRQRCNHLEVPHVLPLLSPILSVFSPLSTLFNLPPHYPPLIFPPPCNHTITSPTLSRTVESIKLPH